MIHAKDNKAQAIYVGGDDQLGEQLDSIIESKTGWSLTHLVDIDIANTVQLQSSHRASATILYVSNELTYSQALRFLERTDRTASPTLVIYDQLESTKLLDLYRAGAIECIGRPVNLTRLSLVLDMLFVPGHNDVNSNNEIGDVSTRPPKEHDDWETEMMDQVTAVASLCTTVLITGETGTGKTRLSRLIHGLSKRKSKPFLALNCGALSESLLDTELFGHVKGAFTGADHNYAGKLSQCRDGTLLLDEIDMLSPMAQVKLLQVVEDRVFQPVGSAKFEPLQARLIVASNRPLQDEVAAGRFRSDLFYRLNVMSFGLPPLRERRHEIQKLVKGFITEYANQHGFPVSSITQHALSAMESYAWPGNIRELRNIVERAVILSAGATIEAKHLSPQVTELANPKLQTSAAMPVASTTNKLADARIEAERAQLLRALDRNQNNRSKTALDLGISRVALYKRLHKLQIL